ncbi:hypothetical protein RAS1_41370 [Phycisphaerae bacterium RAS1]|nr:hypothetical protein RAS1_41370 [Phycisphaerae bacterium RAS1]
MQTPVREGVVIVVVRDSRFLVIRRAAGILAGGAWCFVGGAIESGESQPAAAAREFHEEIGGRIRPIRKVWESCPSPTLKLHWWLAELNGEALRANPAEVAEFRWCTADEIERLEGLLPGNREFLTLLAQGELTL